MKLSANEPTGSNTFGTSKASKPGRPRVPSHQTTEVECRGVDGLSSYKMTTYKPSAKNPVWFPSKKKHASVSYFYNADCYITVAAKRLRRNR